MKFNLNLSFTSIIQFHFLSIHIINILVCVVKKDINVAVIFLKFLLIPNKVLTFFNE